MRLNILIGGSAGQGVNKISEIISQIFSKIGYFTFNYRDYSSTIRGGHNFNIISVSDKRVGSYESRLDIIVALNDETLDLHLKKLKQNGVILNYKKFENQNLGININLTLVGSLIKILGIQKEILIKEIQKEFNNSNSIKATELGYNSEKQKYSLKKLNNKTLIMSGSEGIAIGTINSKSNIYFSYPMTPATSVMHTLSSFEFEKKDILVFQPESEIAGINAAIGASFAGSRVMIGTSGGGFDLMAESLSFQGQSEVPLVVYLASRPGPGTGVPTYTSQADLNIALRTGHGEFPRVVIAPGDPIEAIEKTNEAFYLAEKFNTLSIILSDKHLADSLFSSDRKPNKILNIVSNRKIPGKNEIVKVSSHEHDEFGNTTESEKLIKKNAEKRIETYEKIKKECKKFQMIKIYGNKNSKNLIIGWGSNKTIILDAIEGLDFKFLQVLYLKPLSDEIIKEINKSKKVILIENNSTGQLGRLIREKTGFKIKHKILKYDGRVFASDELKKEILKIR